MRTCPKALHCRRPHLRVGAPTKCSPSNSGTSSIFQHLGIACAQAVDLSPRPQRAWHLPGSDGRWDDQDDQQSGLVQGLSQMGEHVDKAPAKSQEIKNRKSRAGPRPTTGRFLPPERPCTLHRLEHQGSPAGPMGAIFYPKWAGPWPSSPRITLRMTWGTKGCLDSTPSRVDSPRYTAWPGGDLLVAGSAQAMKHHMAKRHTAPKWCRRTGTVRTAPPTRF